MTLPRFSKTTLNGILAFLIAAVPIVQAYPGLGISPKIIAYLSLIAGLARMAVGILQTDADLVPAMVPGSISPQNVPAHPVPDNPADKVVIPPTKGAL
jgi:hypothetical protein